MSNTKYVYVVGKDGTPLMPTKKLGKVRHLLKEGKATVLSYSPYFTIKLNYDTSKFVEPTVLKIDSGYKYIGISVVTETKEVLSSEVELLEDMKERIKDTRKLRRTRRNRLRYRAPRFNNRRRPEGWLAPSIKHKLDSHIKIINNINSILPISRTVVEVASFDTHKLKNPNVSGAMYQEGRQKDFWNVREYVLFRDEYKCQHPKCKNKSKNAVLRVHHYKYWTGSTTDNPDDLITLCDKCHSAKNHQKNGILWGWMPKVSKDLKEAAYMTMVRWRMVNMLKCDHSYGFITKSNRIEAKLPKTHHDDAFCIESSNNQERCETVYLKQIRRNNRSLEKFYDAQYIDSRTGDKTPGKDLFSGRTTRDKSKNSENLHKYRKCKISKGRRSIKTQKYNLKPYDIVLYNGNKYEVKGVQNKGSYVKLKGLQKVPKMPDVKLVCYAKSFIRIDKPA